MLISDKLIEHVLRLISNARFGCLNCHPLAWDHLQNILVARKNWYTFYPATFTLSIFVLFSGIGFLQSHSLFAKCIRAFYCFVYFGFFYFHLFYFSSKGDSFVTWFNWLLQFEIKFSESTENYGSLRFMTKRWKKLRIVRLTSSVHFYGLWFVLAVLTVLIVILPETPFNPLSSFYIQLTNAGISSLIMTFVCGGLAAVNHLLLIHILTLLVILNLTISFYGMYAVSQVIIRNLLSKHFRKENERTIFKHFVSLKSLHLIINQYSRMFEWNLTLFWTVGCVFSQTVCLYMIVELNVKEGMVPLLFSVMLWTNAFIVGMVGWGEAAEVKAAAEKIKTLMERKFPSAQLYSIEQAAALLLLKN